MRCFRGEKNKKKSSVKNVYRTEADGWGEGGPFTEINWIATIVPPPPTPHSVLITRVPTRPGRDVEWLVQGTLGSLDSLVSWHLYYIYIITADDSSTRYIIITYVYVWTSVSDENVYYIIIVFRSFGDVSCLRGTYILYFSDEQDGVFIYLFLCIFPSWNQIDIRD